jgi:hypothetical protein
MICAKAGTAESWGMTAHQLSLRPTVIAGDLLANDYCVKCEGRSIGRIRRSDERTGRWDWAINPPLPVPTWGAAVLTRLSKPRLPFASPSPSYSPEGA